MRLSVAGRWAGALGVALWVVAIAGCNEAPSNVAEVSGNVTLGGEPLPNARVEFIPEGAGTSSMGRTDEDGDYTLIYTRDFEGALLGKHMVRISTYNPGDPESDPPMEAVPEKVPARYNLKTELTATVEKGGNTIDFPLESTGEIVSPDAPGPR